MKAGALILAGVLAATTAYAMPAVQDPSTAQDPARDRDRQREQRPGVTSDQIVPNQTIEGKVTAYTPGKSITVEKKDGATATFTISEKLVVTDNIVPGTKVVIRTHPSKLNMAESITVPVMK